MSEDTERTDAILIERINAILIDRGFHEPHCPIRRVQVANSFGGAYYTTNEPCNCWISE